MAVSAQSQEPTERGRMPAQGRARVVIESVTPSVDGGRFAVKRVLGETIQVEADVFADGHDAVCCRVLYRPVGSGSWSQAPMGSLGNDRWQGGFAADALGSWEYTVEAWVDHFATWQRDLQKRHAAGQDLSVEFRRGEALLRNAAQNACGSDAEALHRYADLLADQATGAEARYAGAITPELAGLAGAYPEAAFVVRHEPWLPLTVDRERARYSTWYELFPRSAGPVPGKHGTLRDVAARLPDIADMGFDVLYLPPIHPIGRRHRKGRNNAITANDGDVGSPWAIGAAEGGHTAVHPELGTPDDVRWLATECRRHGMELALDLAFQCAPDHPYVTEHPEWFLKRPDGTIQYAENPPKKYQDIFPLHFESDEWAALWEELRRVVEHWIAQGVAIFRVDNPHTKPFAFWEWLIGEVRQAHPEVIFLSEAFTRPKVMHRLAKAGFTQSYTYFTWRNTRSEIVDYFTELAHGPGREYFRPNAWPNTPDILPEYLQFGGRPAFAVRLVLAATLAASYGVYGPAFELMEREPREPGSEEYLNSEKYEIRHWDLARPDSLRDLVARVNRIRRDSPALQWDRGLRFHETDNDALLCFTKTSPDGADTVLVVANLDPHHTQSGWIELPLAYLGIDVTRPFQAHDLLSGARFLWHGERNYVELDPEQAPAHVMRLRTRVRSERDFDYFM